MKYRRCDNTITNPMRITKITTGCGTLLPTRSTTSSSRYVNDLGAPVDSLMEPPFVSRGKYDRPLVFNAKLGSAGLDGALEFCDCVPARCLERGAIRVEPKFRLAFAREVARAAEDRGATPRRRRDRPGRARRPRLLVASSVVRAPERHRLRDEAGSGHHAGPGGGRAHAQLPGARAVRPRPPS